MQQVFVFGEADVVTGGLDDVVDVVQLFEHLQAQFFVHLLAGVEVAGRELLLEVDGG